MLGTPQFGVGNVRVEISTDPRVGVAAAALEVVGVGAIDTAETSMAVGTGRSMVGRGMTLTTTETGAEVVVVIGMVGMEEGVGTTTDGTMTDGTTKDAGAPAEKDSEAGAGAETEIKVVAVPTGRIGVAEMVAEATLTATIDQVEETEAVKNAHTHEYTTLAQYQVSSVNIIVNE